MRKATLLFTMGVIIFFWAGQAWSHCEIPCGIYDDQMRIRMISENITTIEKSMNAINRLKAEAPANYNQMIRWTMNKEEHADQIQEIATQYFMTQRIKTGDDDYQAKLVVLHKLVVYAMKCKQTVEVSHVETLRNLLSQFTTLYFENVGSETHK